MAYGSEFLREKMRLATDGLGRADDAVQGAIRNRVFGVDDPETLPSGAGKTAKNILMMPFAARPQAAGDTKFRFTDDTEGRVAMVASRGLQVGGLTAAGVGLAELTAVMMNGYGGPADQPEQATLPLQ